VKYVLPSACLAHVTAVLDNCNDFIKGVLMYMHDELVSFEDIANQSSGSIFSTPPLCSKRCNASISRTYEVIASLYCVRVLSWTVMSDNITGPWHCFIALTGTLASTISLVMPKSEWIVTGELQIDERTLHLLPAHDSICRTRSAWSAHDIVSAWYDFMFFESTNWVST
jgi:hypothetical protein